MTDNLLAPTSRLSDYIEYVGAEEYDLENGLDGPEIPFYLALAGEVGGPVLDLACGTGFLTIPLAKSGYAVTGVDLAPEMLELARRKSDDLSLPIRWELADCRALDLGASFRLVTMTGNAIQEFRTRADLEALLGGIRRHLAPGGIFAFETRFPKMSDLMTPEALTGAWSAESVWRTFENEHGQTVTVSTAQRMDVITQTAEYAVYRRWSDGSEQHEVVERAVLRFIFPQEMEMILHYNGFRIRDAYGDFDRQPLTGSSPRMVFVCEARADEPTVA